MHSETCNLTAFGARLRSERLRLGLNQTELAEIAGLRRNAIVAYEKGSSSPTIECLYRLQLEGLDAGFVVTGTRIGGAADVDRRRVYDLVEQLPGNLRGALLDLLVQMADAVIPPERAQMTLHDREQGYRSEE